MKKVRVEDAVGMTLCHDLTEMRDGFKGPAFRRGHVIAAEDIPHMLDIGKRTGRQTPGRSMRRTRRGAWPPWRRWPERTTRSPARARCC